MQIRHIIVNASVAQNSLALSYFCSFETKNDKFNQELMFFGIGKLLIASVFFCTTLFKCF